MSSLFGIGASGAQASFYNDIATQSVRFDGNAKLTRTPSSSGDQKKWTTSIWVKRCVTGTSHYLWASDGHSGNNGICALYFDSDDKIHTYFDTTGTNPYGAVNARLYRDLSAWYNIIWAVDAANTVQRIWVNGVEESLSSSLNPPNYSYGMNRSGTKNEFGIAAWGSSPSLKGYLSNIVHLDGQYLTNTSFGEFKNGVWIPIDTSGLTFGTNGFHLKLDQAGVGTASSSTIGADTSGNNNHFTSDGMVASDCNMPDSPENNMCTLNSTGRRYGGSYSGTFNEGNLKVASGGNATHAFGTMAINQIASQGGVYFEVRLDSIDGSRTYGGVVGDNGVNNKNSGSNNAPYSFPQKGLIGLMSSPRGYFNTATNASGSLDLTSNSNFGNGDVVGFAILSDGKFFCHRNGTYMTNADGNTGNPSTGANPIATIDLTLGDWLPYVGYNSTFTVNFGQDGSFNSQETSGGNSDANGIGDFMFAVPTNCLAICTSNIEEPTIGPNSATQADNHFGILTWSGDNDARDISVGASGITGTVDFTPDWAWIKRRNGSSNGSDHLLIDTSRGVNQHKGLATNGTSEEGLTAAGSNWTNFGDIVSFKAGGFNGSASGTEEAINESGGTYVAWNWKANGGTTSSNTDGSITSTVQANTTAGFSIVTYTGNATAGATVGHGLGAVPKWYFVKSRSLATGWVTYHQFQNSTPEDGYLALNASDAFFDTITWNDTAPTSSVFSLGPSGYSSNNASATYIAYCFAEIEGYSKFGSYTANESTDGIFIYLGFRPAWVMIKRTAGNGWAIQDSARSTINPVSNLLEANATNAEYTSGVAMDFVSNGIKMRNNSGYFNHVAGNAFIYMAFAEAPFKYANAR